ncbi:hypothetical protein Q31b_25520 [Novipirellula aureliae]|uniref:Uncharacterized protein n=1 Tax=Novipirellula aureliae TaxID=2527966 RepID=A0A5C6E771_9BACT|nr:hypothetical protein Q31b_25520 [Novipirellula aureliae]
MPWINVEMALLRLAFRLREFMGEDIEKVKLTIDKLKVKNR